MEVGLSPGDFVLDWDPDPPIFGPCLLWPNGWMDQDAAWYRVECCMGAGALKYSGIAAEDSRRIGIILKIKSRGNSGNRSAFCGSPAGAG